MFHRCHEMPWVKLTSSCVPSWHWNHPGRHGLWQWSSQIAPWVESGHVFGGLGVFCTQELEVSKTSHLHRFRRNIGTAKDNNMANYIVINEHQQFCKAFVTFEHLWAWLFDFCVELAGWVWIHSVGTCKSLQDQNAGLPRASIGTRNHREASEFRRTSCRTILTRCELNEFDPTKQTALRMLPFSTWPKVGDCVYVCMLPERVVFPWCFKTALDDFPWTWVMWFEQSFA